MIEYEIPFVCLIFTIMLIVAFFSKKRVFVEENYYFKNVLIFTLCVNTTNFISHYLASIYLVNGVDHPYALDFAIINKLGSWFITIILINFLSYILYITYPKYRENANKFQLLNVIIHLVNLFVIFFLEFNVYKAGEITSGSGSSITFAFLIVFICLILAFIISLINRKKYDKRYYSICAIIPIGLALGLFVKFHPSFNIYDLILSILCYLMYFTIENPALKIIQELELANQLTMKANRFKSDFLSSMSHEIRTPLNAIVGFSNDIYSYRDQLPKEVVEDSEDILVASNTLLEIVGNILDFNKIEQGRATIDLTKYNLRSEIIDMTKVTTSRIGNKPIKFTLNFANDIPYELIGDKAKIKSIVNNLLTNAIKYTNEGEINLSFRCVNNLSRNICTLYISCEDTGIGIKQDMTDKLFNKFERLEAGRNDSIEGTGLGLAITKLLVEMIDGDIMVSSTVGVGSLFVVTIPQKISKLVDDSIDNNQDTLELNKDFGHKKVLIVDDNKLNLKVARKALKDYDFEIDEALSGLEAIKMVREDNYDLVLMDITMPNMSGDKALMEMKKDPNFNTPVIALTADALAGAREKYISLGFSNYLAKPFRKEEIEEVLSSIFN